jgi:hypothetical protein
LSQGKKFPSLVAASLSTSGTLVGRYGGQFFLL